MRAVIYVTLKAGVLDPQGKAVCGALRSLGYTEAADVRMGKVIEIALAAEVRDRASAESRVREMCEKLLANPVIEQYRFEIRPEGGA